MGHLILAVDDEADLCVLMERILSRRGYTVTTACGVGEALGAEVVLAAGVGHYPQTQVPATVADAAKPN